MNKEDLIIVTGAAGFIGSCMVQFLNEQGFFQLILVDEFLNESKMPNLQGKKFKTQIDRSKLFNWLERENPNIAFVFHLGARTDTTEFNYAIHQELNVEYSQKIWEYCTTNSVPLIYASSAATYGSGELGYSDDHAIIPSLQPLNAYGVSKNEFDKWALLQHRTPPYWYGLKFFNVYGPNEYHKGRMASVIFHSFNQIRQSGHVKLFKSHRPDFKDGWQLRDFIYVKDVVKVCYWLSKNLPESGIYNLGTGEARAFQELAEATFAGMNLQPQIDYIDMPEDIREKYQYFTEAEMGKLRKAGYEEPFCPLEEGVADYVRNYLVPRQYY